MNQLFGLQHRNHGVGLRRRGVHGLLDDAVVAAGAGGEGDSYHQLDGQSLDA